MLGLELRLPRLLAHPYYYQIQLFTFDEIVLFLIQTSFKLFSNEIIKKLYLFYV